MQVGATDGDAQASKPRRQRGASFPVIALPGAVKIIRDAGSYGNKHSMAAMATYAGHATTNSGTFKSKMAALRDWGLITGTGDTVVLTDTAMRIAHPPSPEEAANALSGAFRGCPVFWKFYEEAAKGKDLDLAALANNAVNNYSISVASKDQFVKSLIDSAEAVGLAERVPGNRVRLITPSSQTPPELHDSGQANGQDIAIPPAGGANAKKVQPVISQIWPLKQGEISFEIRSTKAIPASAFGQVGKVVEQIQELAQTLTDAETADDAISG
jgi:hypothetical protein